MLVHGGLSEFSHLTHQEADVMLSIIDEEHCNSYDFAKFVCVKPLCYLTCKIFFQKHVRSYSCEGTWPKRKCVAGRPPHSARGRPGVLSPVLSHLPHERSPTGQASA
ncbi:hypothetical protein E2562_031893 [Oryza meyeriana var. granulata]|uniref:Uncharacterized protein n=1 Tax=Oryza meyeriana var. granulata TaxID=110450 RepID=A0A6G1F069_9ORYZ|nr:hypothetical protein E2562_031893 [Oryza meyeriana var. granulata]